jgi:hypothetical protein
MAIDKSRYDSIVNTIIDKVEGGYYHPAMLEDGRVKDSRYAGSGETMFGIDRKAGGGLNNTAAAKKFWNIIDTAKASKYWKWNYKGGNLEPSLKKLAGDIMYPEYERLSGLYLTDKSRKIVESDDRLLFNFIYAAWNGAGWFKKFSVDFNNAVNKGVTDKNKLVEIAINSRVNNSNNLISQEGKKIAGFIDTLSSDNYSKNNIGKSLVILALISVVGYLIFKKGKLS